MFRSIANRLLPTGSAPRKLHFGLAKGAIATIDFRLDAAFYFGRHEPELVPHYRRLLRRGTKCFDIGMYRGWDALGFAHVTGAPVVSFDGNPNCIDMTNDFLRPSNVHVTKVCAYMSDGADGNLTIDQAAQKYFTPDFIKMDVEGSEATLLRGASKTLSRCPILVIETHGERAENECISILESHSYRPLIIEGSRGIFSATRVIEHNRWLICASPKSS